MNDVYALALIGILASAAGYLLDRRIRALETSLANLWKHVRKYLPSSP